MKRKILLASIVLAAVGMLLASTYPHIGACPDSTVYVGVAKNWLAGRGLTMPVVGVPLTHYPPLYPLILSAAGFFGVDMLQWALGWDLILLIANILLAGVIASRMGFRDTTLPVALVALCPGILTVHWMVWSEPVFIFLGFAGLVTLDIYLKSRRSAVLLVAGVIMALAWLDRYIGIALIAGAGGTLWLFSHRRVRDLLVFGIVSSAPLLLWLSHNVIRFGNATNRTIAFKPITPLEGLTLILELLMAGALYLFLKRRNGGTIHQMLALTIFAHTAVLAFAVCLADSGTPVLDTRIQVPVMFAGLLLLPWLAGLLQPRTARILSALLVLVVVLQLLGSLIYSAVGFVQGLEYSDGRWVQGSLSIPPHPWDELGQD